MEGEIPMKKILLTTALLLGGVLLERFSPLKHSNEV